MGIIVGSLALVTLVYALRMKPRVRSLVGLAAGVGVDILIQAILGFGVLGTSSNYSLSNALAYVHFERFGNRVNGIAGHVYGDEDSSGTSSSYQTLKLRDSIMLQELGVGNRF